MLFFYGLPLYKWRYDFRSVVYGDDSWKINFRPWFVKETIALFSNTYFENNELRMAWKYRLYLAIYAVLFGAFLYVV